MVPQGLLAVIASIVQTKLKRPVLHWPYFMRALTHTPSPFCHFANNQLLLLPFLTGRQSAMAIKRIICKIYQAWKSGQLKVVPQMMPVATHSKLNTAIATVPFFQEPQGLE